MTFTPSFLGDAKHRTRNLEIPRCAIAHLRSGANAPSRNDGVTSRPLRAMTPDVGELPHLDPGLVRNFFPDRDILLDEVSESLRRRADDLHGLAFEQGFGFRILQGFDDFRIEPRHDLGWRAPWRQNAVPAD